MKEFSRKELAGFDGKDGRPPYVAAGGKVYDLSESELWKGGKHMEKHEAGHDQSDALERAPHGVEVFDRVKEVGVLPEEPAEAAKAPPPWARLILKLHPHPINVHFPQAFFLFAPLFLLAAYYLDGRYFERTAYYLEYVGLIPTVPAILSGPLHWAYKYGARAKFIFRFKIGASLVLVLLAGFTFFLHTNRGHLPTDQMDRFMLSLYFAHIPLIVLLGFAGGRIVFGPKK